MEKRSGYHLHSKVETLVHVIQCLGEDLSARRFVFQIMVQQSHIIILTYFKTENLRAASWAYIVQLFPHQKLAPRNFVVKPWQKGSRFVL